MTAKLLQEYHNYKAYIQRHRSAIDHDLKSVYGVQYPVDDVDRLNLVLFDETIRAQADRELRVN